MLLRIALPIAAALTVVGCTKPVPPIFEEAVPLAMPTGANTLGARLNPGNTVMLSWIERAENGGTLLAASWGLDGWNESLSVASDPKMFVNWADLPSVSDLGNGQLIAHWLSYSADLTYSYDVVVSQSADGGRSWSSPMRPHDDGTPTEHGFVSLFPIDDQIGLIWLDGRETEAEGGGMTLRSAFVDQDGKLSGEQLLDEFICDCCQTDVAVSSAGPITVYRDRSRAEIRDIYLSRYLDGAWTAGEPFSNDGWHITGCPVNGPAIAARDDLVAVAWFTVANNVPRVWVRTSTDGGANFGDAVQIATGTLLGHVDISYVGENSFAVSWMARGRPYHEIRVRSVTTSGDLGVVRTVGKTAIERNVPQMQTVDGNLMFVWTDRIGEAERVVGVTSEIVHAE